MIDEKTEKLLPEKEQSKNFYQRYKKWILIGLVLILVAVLAVVYYQYQKKVNYQKNLEIGIEYLNEGNYEQAILAFNEALTFEKNPYIQEKLAQSEIYNGNIEEGKEILTELYEETGVPKYEILAQTAGTGKLSSNAANFTYYLQGFDGIYGLSQDTPSNKIIKFSYDEEDSLGEEETVYSSTDPISNLNLDGDYLYFIIANTNNPKICRIRTDGSDYEELFVPNSYCSLSDLNIIGDRMFFVRNNNQGINRDYPLYVIDHDKNNKTGGSIIFYADSIARITSSDTDLFIYGKNNKENTANNIVYKYDADTQELETLINPGSSKSLLNLIYSNDCLYFETLELGGTGGYGLVEYNIDTGKQTVLKEGTDSYNFGVLGKKLYYSFNISGDDLPYYPSEEVEFYINIIDLETQEEVPFFTAKVEDSLFKNKEINQPSITDFNFLGNTIFFKEEIIMDFAAYTRNCTLDYEGKQFKALDDWFTLSY